MVVTVIVVRLGVRSPGVANNIGAKSSERNSARVTTVEPVTPPPPPPSNRTKLGECVDRLAAKGVSKDEMLRILEISYSDEPTVEEGDAQISAVVLERADKIQSDF